MVLNYLSVSDDANHLAVFRYFRKLFVDGFTSQRVLPFLGRLGERSLLCFVPNEHEVGVVSFTRNVQEETISQVRNNGFRFPLFHTGHNVSLIFREESSVV